METVSLRVPTTSRDLEVQIRIPNNNVYKYKHPLKM